jgi:hypothetical protein
MPDGDIAVLEIAERLALAKSGSADSWKRKINRGVQNGSLARLAVGKGDRGANLFRLPPSLREVDEKQPRLAF